jgi:hypothetical protein
MDIGLYVKVLWRARLLVAAGLFAACVLAFLSLVSISFRGSHPVFHYRSSILYSSTVQELVTQPGFTEGRSVFDTSPTTLPSGQTLLPQFADPSRFSDLAVLYSQLVMGNAVYKLVFGNTIPSDRLILASPMAGPNGNGTLPVLQITAVAPSDTGAMALADRAARAFATYLATQQAAAATPQGQRVSLQRIAGPLRPQVFKGRKSIAAIFLFLLVLSITVAAAFIRENFRTRKEAEESLGDEVEPAPMSAPPAKIGKAADYTSRRP